MKKIIFVIGARPNFMKVAPLLRCWRNDNNLKSKYDVKVLHTGQHFDEEMSGIFLKILEIGNVDHNLNVGFGSHAEQTAKIMIGFEKYCLNQKPDLVVVVGDVNSTLACSIVAKKLNIKLCHIEAGLRSNDRLMPEEINRIVTDSITDLFFTTCEEASEQLLKENHNKDNIFFVGNLMIDSLFYHFLKVKNGEYDINISDIPEDNFVLLTLHRPSNVDSYDSLKNYIELFNELSVKEKIYFPCHPRTYKSLERFNLLDSFNERFILGAPADYLKMLYLYSKSNLVFTDSGGIQEETTALGIPCLTLRENTERPITVTLGTNTLVGSDNKLITKLFEQILDGKYKQAQNIDKWDGQAAHRLWVCIDTYLN